MRGVAIGDAFGMPWETLSPEAILELTGGLGPKTFWAPQQSRVTDTANLPAGATTDDLQLTLVVARSLLATGGRIDLGDCAQKHVDAMAESQFGWGGTTRRAIESIRDGKRTLTEPLPKIPGGGAGNGIIMKVAPLAIVSAARGDSPTATPFSGDPLFVDCEVLGGLTHPATSAASAAYAVAFVMRRLLVNGHTEPVGEHLLAAVEAASLADRKIGAADRGVGESILLAGRLGSAEYYRIARKEKLAFCATETAAFAISSFIEAHAHEGSSRFVAGLCSAVAAGGDTDTNASIVGALLGASLGEEKIPPEWAGFSPEFELAADVGQILVETFAAS